jgi:hypothetical protein
MQEQLFLELNDAERFAAAGHVELTFKRALELVKDRISRLLPPKGRLDPEDERKPAIRRLI